MLKIFIIINHGCVQGVYSDSNAVEVEVIDLDSQEEEERNQAEHRAQEVAAFYSEVG